MSGEQRRNAAGGRTVLAATLRVCSGTRGARAGQGLRRPAVAQLTGLISRSWSGVVGQRAPSTAGALGAAQRAGPRLRGGGAGSRREGVGLLGRPSKGGHRPAIMARPQPHQLAHGPKSTLAGGPQPADGGLRGAISRRRRGKLGGAHTSVQPSPAPSGPAARPGHSAPLPAAIEGEQRCPGNPPSRGCRSEEQLEALG